MIEPLETHQITDATKLRAFILCPRRYFFDFVLGWRGQGANLHLVFGSAWHLAMEYLLSSMKDGRYDPDLGPACILFIDEYCKSFPGDWETENAPKNIETAKKALIAYFKKYSKEDFKVLYTEISGSVPIDDKHDLYFRLDAIIEDSAGINVLEHKTTGYNSPAWRGQWDLSMQIGAYMHALYCIYPPEQVAGVTVNGAVFCKTKIDFLRIPIVKTLEQQQVWLWNTRYHLQELDRCFDALTDASEDDDVLQTFPMRANACTSYNRMCPFHQYCMAWPNPLQRCHEPPPGMKIEHWDPRERPAKHTLGVEGIK